MSFSAEELVEFVATVVVKVAQPQFFLLKSYQRSHRKEVKCLYTEMKLIYLNNDEYTRLDAGHGTTDILDMAFVASSLKSHDTHFRVAESQQAKKFISGRTLILSKFLCLMNEILIISTDCYLYDTVSNLSVRSAESASAQLTPRHSPHAVEHGKPCFLQLHFKFTQPLLQLHRIVNSKSAGAYIKSMDFGINLPSTSFHPHRSGSISSPFPFHSLIW